MERKAQDTASELKAATMALIAADRDEEKEDDTPASVSRAGDPQSDEMDVDTNLEVEGRVLQEDVHAIDNHEDTADENLGNAEDSNQRDRDTAEESPNAKQEQTEKADHARSQTTPIFPRMFSNADDDTGSVRTTQSSDDQVPTENGEEGKLGSPVPSHLPDYLDRATINSMKSYLMDFAARKDTGRLQEDEIFQLMIKTDRNVEHRARYYSNPLDDLVDEDQMYKDFYKEEEEYLIGHDFIKEMTSKIQKTKRRAMDKRTLNWVKRAAGLKRKDYHSPHSAVGRDDDESDENEGTRKAPRRYTRGMARNTRIKKKEEFMFMDSLGLKSLLDTIEEMEPTLGPYPVPFECLQNRDKRQSPEKGKLGSRDDDDDDDESSLVDRRSTFDPTVMRPLVARLSEEDSAEGLARNSFFIFGEHRDLLVTKILVNGKHVEEDEEDRMSLKERKRELKRLRDRQYQKRRRDRKIALKERGSQRPMLTTPIRSNIKRRRDDYDSASDDNLGPHGQQIRTVRTGRKGSSRKAFSGSLAGARPLRGNVSLPLLDWQRRQLWSPRRRTKKEAEVEETRNMQIPDYLKKWGITFRLPPWEAVNPALTLPEDVEPVRKRHPDEVYAAWCHKLINCLNGSARSWAIHEFFYSDLDRVWYSSNTFAKEAAKLGIPPTAKLTRGEWGVVRRTIRKCPRRFSKKFILAQLAERNEFRNMVRHLQLNPDDANRSGYAVPAPIRVGATVTAYNKRLQILHRGVVLFHDVANAQYLVQFERSELGFQICPDTEVASHGLPNVLMLPVPRQLSPSPYKASTGSFLETGEIPYGTSRTCLSGADDKEDLTCEKELSNLLARTHSESPIPWTENNGDEARSALIEKVAERETLVELMSIIDVACSRKARLLDLLDKFNCLLVDKLPFGGGAPPNHVISEYFEGHYVWLESNLMATNHSLERAMAYLKVMYAGAYSATTPTANSIKDEVVRRFIECTLAEEKRFGGGPPAETVHWISALHHGSHDVGDFLASLVIREDPTASDGNSEPPTSNKHVLRQRLAAAGGILSSIGYCCNRSAESDITMPNGDAPFVDVIIASGLTNQAPQIPHCDRNGDVRDMLDERALAEQELMDALACLRKEFMGISYASRSAMTTPS